METPKDLASQNQADVQARGPFRICIIMTIDALDGKCKNGLEIKRYSDWEADLYIALEHHRDILFTITTQNIPVQVVLTDREYLVLTLGNGMLI